jgi:hypothetical protein
LPDPGFVSVFKGFIVKSLHAVRTNRPMTGRAAFVRAGTMKSPGACGAAFLHRAYPSGWSSLFQATQLYRNEDRTHPGEGNSA